MLLWWPGWLSCLLLCSCRIDPVASFSAETVNLAINGSFMFGAGTSAYQIEGAWDEDGKGESVWDRYTHTHPEGYPGGANGNGDIACDSYHNIDRDVGMLVDLGVHFYRFSISWPRILPSGFDNEVNVKGVDYYRRLLQKLHENNIMPFVTMFHWDLPLSVDDLGGWTNVLTVDYFEDYARVLFENFADLVPMWVTFNEPSVICQTQHVEPKFPPKGNTPAVSAYLCMHNLLKAHARVFHLYKQQYGQHGGKLGLTPVLNWFYPRTNQTADIEATNRLKSSYYGWQLDPVYSKLGDYPEVLKDRIEEQSIANGFRKSNLPTFTADEVKYIQGTYDFLGVNYYSTYYVSARTNHSVVPTYEEDIGIKISYINGSDSLKIHPEGLRHTLNYMRQAYNNPVMYITENGLGTDDALNDQDTITFLQDHLSIVHQAQLDGCNVRGFAVWSLMDAFEWSQNKTAKYGLYYTNFSDPKRPITPKASALFYKNFIAETNSNFSFHEEISAGITVRPCHLVLCFSFAILFILYA